MNAVATQPEATEVSASFIASHERFSTVLGFLDGAEAAAATHAQLEEHLQVASRELFRQLYQDHLDLRAQRETRVAVLGADGIARSRAETDHTRALSTVFGQVQVRRIAYRAPGSPNLHPADAALNLPAEHHSHGLRRLPAVEATRGSYDDAVDGIATATGQRLGKRQVEALTARAAVDTDAFYTLRKPPPGAGDDVLVLSCDGKGIVMRADALRPATAKAAATATLAGAVLGLEVLHVVDGPGPDGVDGDDEAATEVGEGVLHAGRDLCVDLAAHQAVTFHGSQGLGEDLGGDAADRVAELGEPVRAALEDAHDEHGPAVADPVQGQPAGAARVVDVAVPTTRVSSHPVSMAR